MKLSGITKTKPDSDHVFYGSPYELMQIIGTAEDIARHKEHDPDFDLDKHQADCLELWRKGVFTVTTKEHGHYEASDLPGEETNEIQS